MSGIEGTATGGATPAVTKPIKRTIKKRPILKPVVAPPVAVPGPKRDVRPPDSEIMLIISSKTVDKFNTVRKRIELTPAVCKTCGFNVCERNDLEDYYEMDADTQKRVRDTLAAHIKVAHTQGSQHLIPKSELATRWLGKGREEKEAARNKIREG